MIENNLKKLGFTNNEIKIYLTLVRLGKIRAGDVIKETGLQRSVVYNSLEELIERELVTKTLSKGVATYSINDPDALVQEAEERRLLAETTALALKEKQSVKDREVVVYEGKDIIKRISDKSLGAKSGSTIYFLGPSKFGIQSNLEKYWKHFHKERINKNIKCKILYDRNTDNKILVERNNLPLCEAKYLPIEAEIPMWFSICGDLVGMIIPSEEPPLAFLIKSPKTAEALTKYFDYLWAQK